MLAVLGETCGEVGVVVLDADELDALALEGVLRGQVLRVEVVHDDLGLDGEEAPEVLDALGEGAQRLVVLEVADVVADPGARAARQAERVLQLGAAGQERARRADRQRQRLRHMAAGAPQCQRRPHH